MILPERRILIGPSPQEHEKAEHDDDESRDNSQPGIEFLRNDVLGSIQSDRAKRVDACGVRKSDDSAEQDRVRCRAARADQIRCDQSLSMSGFERMQRAQSHRDKSGTKEKP